MKYGDYVDIDSFCAYIGVRVLSYAVSRSVIQAMHIEHFMRKHPCFCCVYQKERIIFFNSTLPYWQIILGISVCLGYLLLGYVRGREKMKLMELFKARIFALKLLWLITKANPRYPFDIIRADIDRLKARRKRKALPAPANGR